jgi:hypothetical protein
MSEGIAKGTRCGVGIVAESFFLPLDMNDLTPTSSMKK